MKQGRFFFLQLTTIMLQSQITSACSAARNAAGHPQKVVVLAGQPQVLQDQDALQDIH